METIKEVELVVESTVVGEVAYDCIRESMQLAVKEWRVVKLLHNAKIYTIDPIVLSRTIKPETTEE